MTPLSNNSPIYHIICFKQWLKHASRNKQVEAVHKRDKGLLSFRSAFIISSVFFLNTSTKGWTLLTLFLRTPLQQCICQHSESALIKTELLPVWRLRKKITKLGYIKIRPSTLDTLTKSQTHVRNSKKEETCQGHVLHHITRWSRAFESCLTSQHFISDWLGKLKPNKLSPGCQNELKGLAFEKAIENRPGRRCLLFSRLRRSVVLPRKPPCYAGYEHQQHSIWKTTNCHVTSHAVTLVSRKHCHTLVPHLIHLPHIASTRDLLLFGVLVFTSMRKDKMQLYSIILVLGEYFALVTFILSLKISGNRLFW